MEHLLLRMQSHWVSLNGSSEIKILRNYATDSQKMTMLYTSKINKFLTSKFHCGNKLKIRNKNIYKN